MAKKIIDQEEMKECTFKPELNTNPKNDLLSKSVLSNSGATTTGGGPTNGPPSQPKYEQLYGLKKDQKDKQDKSKQDYEYERNKEELTFAPKITSHHNTAPQRNTDESVVHDRAVQKQVERLNKAREDKDRIKNMTERGYQKTGNAGAESNGNFQNESVMSNTTSTAQTTKRPMTSSRKSPRIVEPK